MELIDSHCHLDRFHQRHELAAVLARASAAGVNQLITIGTCEDDWPLYEQLTAVHPGRIHWTAGLHPSDVTAVWEQQVARLPAYWEKAEARPVAVGEIGLDHFRLPKDAQEAAAVKAWQEAAFRRQLDLAARFEMPVVVHSRAAFADCVRVIGESGFPWERVVFHCFADGAAEITQLNQCGGRGSFTGIITYKSAQAVRDACLAQGREMLMVETDAPYLAPVPHRGKTCEPSMVRDTAVFIAELLGVSPEELAAELAHTTRRFFSI